MTKKKKKILKQLIIKSQNYPSVKMLAYDFPSVIHKGPVTTYICKKHKPCLALIWTLFPWRSLRWFLPPYSLVVFCVLSRRWPGCQFGGLAGLHVPARQLAPISSCLGESGTELESLSFFPTWFMRDGRKVPYVTHSRGAKYQVNS